MVLVVDHSALLMMGVAGKTKLMPTLDALLVTPLPSDTLTLMVSLVLAGVSA